MRFNGSSSLRIPDIWNGHLHPGRQHDRDPTLGLCKDCLRIRNHVRTAEQIESEKEAWARTVQARAHCHRAQRKLVKAGPRGSEPICPSDTEAPEGSPEKMIMPSALPNDRP
jgi:hypothetical protein